LFFTAQTLGAFLAHDSDTIAGTNVMIRARACFMACKFGEDKLKRKRFWHVRKTTCAGSHNRQLFSEVLIAEDVDLGSRIHALGYKSVFLNEVLARGEVRRAILNYPDPDAPCSVSR
jgi:cellulose synthase/poly-beta-1,6-N-acetylglucosamine synthase-like glycosyltransferase